MGKDKGGSATPKKNPSRHLWSKDASCAGRAGFDYPKSNAEKEKNRTICLDCPVLDLCLIHAIAYKEEGFWAGTTKADRNHLRKELPQEALSLVASESHKAFEFGTILSDKSVPLVPVKRLPLPVDLELYI